MSNAVLFDAGGTLIHEDPLIPEVFTRVARSRGHDVTAHNVEPCMAQIDAYYQQEYLRNGDFWCVHEHAVQIWLDMYAMMADYCGIRDANLPQAVYDEYLKPSNWAFFPDAQACLKDLKRRGFRLGIVSNWDSSLEGLLRDMGYLPYFDTVISSASVGYRKPNGTIFEIALERMGEDASDVVHVGDLIEADGKGALSAGIRPIIIDRKGILEDCPFERVSLLTELVSLL